MEQASPLSNTPTPTMTTPPVNPPSSNKNVLIILLIILVVILSSLVTYLLVKPQAPSPTPISMDVRRFVGIISGVDFTYPTRYGDLKERARGNENNGSWEIDLISNPNGSSSHTLASVPENYINIAYEGSPWYLKGKLSEDETDDSLRAKLNAEKYEDIFKIERTRSKTNIFAYKVWLTGCHIGCKLRRYYIIPLDINNSKGFTNLVISTYFVVDINNKDLLTDGKLKRDEMIRNGLQEIIKLEINQGEKEDINRLTEQDLIFNSLSIKKNTDQNNNWNNFQFSPTISFNIPLQTKVPLCINSGCYAKETKLPGGTYFQIWGADGANPGGKEASWTYDAVLDKLTTISFQKQTYDLSDHRAIRFSSNQSQSTFIIGGNVYSQIEGVFVETKNGMLMLAHYLPKNADQNASFDNDNITFDQILSTFKFLE